MRRARCSPAPPAKPACRRSSCRARSRTWRASRCSVRGRSTTSTSTRWRGPPMRDAAPLALIATAVVALAVWGPIAQPPHYHEFADTRSIFGIPNGADVLSNAGFALAGIWGLSRLWMRGGWQARHRPGWTLFLAAVVLTSAGSTYYHLQPDN